ncbi:MAG: hypothetical protein AAGA18_06190 [Verrucomicrobiota bacterium]
MKEEYKIALDFDSPVRLSENGNVEWEQSPFRWLENIENQHSDDFASKGAVRNYSSQTLLNRLIGFLGSDRY